MKIYLIDYSLNERVEQAVYASKYSTFKVGIKVPNASSIRLYDGDVEKISEEGLFNGYTVWQFTIGEPGKKFYVVNADGKILKLSIVSTDSNCSELSAGGGSAYELPTASSTRKGGIKVDGNNLCVENEVLKVTGLDQYATVEDLNLKADLTALGDYQPKSDMTAYATVEELTTKADITALGDYQPKSDMTAYAEVSSVSGLANYPIVSKSEASSTVDDNTINTIASTVTDLKVPSSIRDTVVYFSDLSTITWDVSEWTKVYSDDSDVWTYTVPALFTFTKIANGEVLVMKKDITELTA